MATPTIRADTAAVLQAFCSTWQEHLLLDDEAVSRRLADLKVASDLVWAAGCTSGSVLQAAASSAWQELYLMGGNDGANWVENVEIFCPGRGTWVQGKPMPSARCAAGRTRPVMQGSV